MTGMSWLSCSLIFRRPSIRLAMTSFSKNYIITACEVKLITSSSHISQVGNSAQKWETSYLILLLSYGGSHRVASWDPCFFSFLSTICQMCHACLALGCLPTTQHLRCHHQTYMDLSYSSITE